MAYNHLSVRNYDHLVHPCTQSLLIDSMRLHWLTSQLTVTITDYHTLSHTQSSIHAANSLLVELLLITAS
jgi:hypothetical protein